MNLAAQSLPQRIVSRCDRRRVYWIIPSRASLGSEEIQTENGLFLIQREVTNAAFLVF